MDKSQATELTNKIRWAIGTTIGEARNGDFSMNYREQMWLASLLTDDVAGVLSALEVAADHQGHDFTIDRKLLSNLLTQVKIGD